ncbi:MAG: AI-2E family transporter [Elusimicrobia bacterium]|nr:AI-2E family transporter [Elusimicrobiota bacterium]
MEEKTNRVHFITYLVILCIFLILVLWMIGSFLLSIFFGGMLAMLFYPVYKWLILKKWKPHLASAVVTISILVLFIGPIVGFSIMAIRQGVSIMHNISGLRDFSPSIITNSLNRWQVVKTAICETGSANTKINSGILAALEYVELSILKLAKNIPIFLLQIVLSVISCFFALLDGERFLKFVFNLGILDKQVQNNLVKSFKDTAVSSIWASLASSTSDAVLLSLMFFIMEVPGVFVAGGTTFILAWIPFVGAVPVWLIGIVYLYLKGSMIKMIFMIIGGLITGALEHMVRILILHGRTAMHPLLGLVAVLGGIKIIGILGVFIGPVLVALLIALVKIWPISDVRSGI